MTWYLLHTFTVFLSISSFFVRGMGHLQQRPWVHKPWVRIHPHIVDTLLLVSAIMLVVEGGYSWLEPWILTKIVLLILYVFLGVMSFRIAKTQGKKFIYWVAALFVVFYMIAVAHSRSPLPFPSFLVN